MKTARAWAGWVLMWVVVVGIAVAIAFTFGPEPRDRWLLLAAATLTITGALHAVLGERFILQPLFHRSSVQALFGDQAFTRRVLRFVWHLFSISLIGFAVILITLVGQPPSAETVGRILSLTAFAFAVVTLCVSRGRQLAWVAFAVAGGGAWLGS